MPPRQAFSLIMSIAYAAAGLALLLTNAFDRLLPKYRTVIGALLIAYGAFRLAAWMRARRTGRSTDTEP